MSSFKYRNLPWSLLIVLYYVDIIDCYTYYIPDRGKKTSNEELRDLTEELYSLDTFEYNKYVRLNFQHKTYYPNITHYSLYEFPEKAQSPLIEIKDKSLYNVSTVRALLELFPHFNPDINGYEINSRRKRKLKKRFLNKVCNTPVMQKMQQFFIKKGDLKSDSLEEYFTFLSDMWFEPFKRDTYSQHVSSSGFEHTFLAEYSKNETHIRVYGFHNWLYFHYLETLNQSLAYHGFSRRRAIGNNESKTFELANVFMDWQDCQRVGGMIMGISPELELALYTLCVMYRTNDPDGCRISLGGSEVVIRAFEYYVKKQRYISSVFPVFDYRPWNLSVTTTKRPRPPKLTEPKSMFMF
ncbi:hypothetical protein WDU94_013719 [Cyamophila willieti]